MQLSEFQEEEGPKASHPFPGREKQEQPPRCTPGAGNSGGQITSRWDAPCTSGAGDPPGPGKRGPALGLSNSQCPGFSGWFRENPALGEPSDHKLRYRAYSVTEGRALIVPGAVLPFLVKIGGFLPNKFMFRLWYKQGFDLTTVTDTLCLIVSIHRVSPRTGANMKCKWDNTQGRAWHTVWNIGSAQEAVVTNIIITKHHFCWCFGISLGKFSHRPVKMSFNTPLVQKTQSHTVKGLYVYKKASFRETGWIEKTGCFREYAFCGCLLWRSQIWGDGEDPNGNTWLGSWEKVNAWWRKRGLEEEEPSGTQAPRVLEEKATSAVNVASGGWGYFFPKYSSEIPIFRKSSTYPRSLKSQWWELLNILFY